MKFLKIASTFLFLFAFMSIQAQTKKSKEAEKNKVSIYTPEEKDNMQNWFYERVNEMKLSETKREEYYSVILYYTYKMARLDDKDLGYTRKEIETKFDALLKKQDIDIKAILTQEAYEMHKTNYKELIRGVKKRMAKTNYE